MKTQLHASPTCPQVIRVLLFVLASLHQTGAIGDDQPKVKAGLSGGLISFEDKLVSGSSYTWGIDLAMQINPRLQVGYAWSSSLGNASMDDDGDIHDGDDFETHSTLLYARLGTSINDDSIAYFKLGRSTIEIESKASSACLFLCGDIISIDSETHYRNRETGFAYAIGVQVNSSINRQLTIEYIDLINQESIDNSGIYVTYFRVFDFD
jgi:opacity protein-like surface antigen